MNNFDSKMEIFKENTVINWHEHVWPNKNGAFDERQCDSLVETAEKTFMDKVVCSVPISGEGATPEAFRRCNDILYAAMKRHPGKIKGFAYVNPGYGREALEEIDRCINELGMIGIKLYNQYFISDPVVRPIIEMCIQLDIPILEHAGKLNYMPEGQPFISHGPHFAKVAKDYPEAIIIEAHIGGGGDWQWSLKAIADCPNIFTDTSGSVHDDGIIEEVVKAMGADRILFGTDGSISPGLGKILGADIPCSDKIKILNNTRFARYLERGL